jgi:sirohydrochlorin ferrochelatase
LRSEEAVERFVCEIRRQRALDCRARLNREPGLERATLAHASEIRRRKVFADVECAFWKEEPSLRDALFLFDPAEVREVYVVPNFISEGYFNQTVVPRERELNGRTTKRSSDQI